MAISKSVELIDVDKLFLDAKNPRIGRHLTSKHPSQDDILDWMNKKGVLEELAVSFLENGFWTQEAVVVIKEKTGQKKELVVVEGNRRLSALKMLWKAHNGEEVSPKWQAIAETATEDQMQLLKEVPYIQADTREEVQAYLGFRHVSGIKEWNPAEKAEFIAHLIDDQGMTYQEVMRSIGSKIPTVRQLYISFRILLQMEQQCEDISIEKVEKRFSVLYLSLRTKGVQQYLDVDIPDSPQKSKKPVPIKKLKELSNFALWLFGTDVQEPIVRDSRQTDQFGVILESTKAVEYLERNKKPLFETAFRIAGGDELETTQHIERAADEVGEALKSAHHHKSSKKMKEAIMRLSKDFIQLMEIFPDEWNELFSEE